MNDTTPSSSENPGIPPTSTWKKIVKKYQLSSTGRAVWQLVNTLVPYAALWVLMYFTIQISWWLTLPLAIIAGAFLVRTFIIFHDCTHDSFFASRRANTITGFLTGLLTFTSYHMWRYEHSLHHSTAGDLDRRGVGDVWTLTVQEYLAASRWKRFVYRINRNPIVLFVIAPMVLFIILYRFSSAKAGKRERLSLYASNAGLAVIAVALALIFGIKAYLFIQLVILAVASMSGVWLFYVQHQFEEVYWEHGEEWDFTKAALEGSSFYKLPKIFQWFSGNIGFHHIHHLSPRIPNYHLERAHESEPLFRTVKPLTLRTSLKSFTFRLWDENDRKLVGYKRLKAFRQQAQQTVGPSSRD